ncbi:MAG: hypothetical protein IJS03_08760 [Eubacterium sp.]|nr:hypothetical protein [Eubacterium sp.]
MKKIETRGSQNLLLKFVIKVVLSTLISISVVTYLLTLVVYNLDLDLDLNIFLSVIVCAAVAAITAFVSVYGVKNSGALLGIAAQIPLLFYSLVNMIFNENSFLFFVIKCVIIVLIGALFGILAVNRTRKSRFKI